jgi:Protein of unknown function (DUF2889)
MPPHRSRMHTRSITIEAYERADGLFDLEVRLLDTKDHDLDLVSGSRKAGNPIHDMMLCLTINRELDVVGVVADANAVPYPGACEASAPSYVQLVGLNLLDRFRKRSLERVGGIKGCSHMTELAAILPTAAVQAFAGRVNAPRNDGDSEKPFQLDRCHALVTDGESVRRFYPTWYRSRQVVAG